MAEQNIIIASDDYIEIDNYIKINRIKKILLVCDDSIKFLRINSYFENLKTRLGISIVRFSDFQPNPLYESVVKGIKVLLNERYDVIMAVGGGSAMDVAKCIKLYANMNHTQNYLTQQIIPNDIKLLAIPTTAGTGSEATRYAVIYYNGEKQSITDNSIIPSTVVFDPTVLTTLPIYQKKATLMDAFCHAIESFWSVNSSEESKSYSKQVIELILANMNSYLAGNIDKNIVMLKAAYIAGKAINITQTTAGHAMCYKLSSLYGIAHGHAAALCTARLWLYMADNLDNCIDARGTEYVAKTFREIAVAMGYNCVENAIYAFKKILDKLELSAPEMRSDADFEILKVSVNPVRLKNNPIMLTVEAIDELYHGIFEGK